MNDQAAIVKQHLTTLGIDADAVTIYLELIRRGFSSALQLAKATGISRTQVYRCLEELTQKSLASAEQLNYGTLYRPLPIDNIEHLLVARESETAAVRNDLGMMTEALRAIAGGAGTPATVRHHYGIAGLKQANWNLTKADKEYRVFEAAHLDQHLDKEFARRHRERCIERNLISYDLTNDTVVRLQDIEPIILEQSFVRHIDPGVLTINFEIYIYNDVVTLLDYRRGHELAIEMHHPILHGMMRQLFDAMWAQATPLEITR